MSYVVRPISDRTAFTGEQTGNPFSSTWSATERLLLDEIAKLKGEHLVIEVDVRESDIRLDGRLRSGAVAATPAARVAFKSEHGPLTYGTDRYGHWQTNVRAIALGLEALRKVDRYGITKRGEQYTGFRALGAGRAMPASHMTTEQACDVLCAVLDLASVADLDIEDAVLVRRARAAAHPDRRQGDQTLWDQVELAAAVLGVTR